MMCITLYVHIDSHRQLLGRGQGAANCTTNGSPCFISILSSAAAVASDLSVTWRGRGGWRDEERERGDGGTKRER